MWLPTTWYSSLGMRMKWEAPDVLNQILWRWGLALWVILMAANVGLGEGTVLVSSCCCNKLLQTWCFKTMQIYLELRSLKFVSLRLSQGVGKAVFLVEAPRNLFPCPFQLLMTCISWFVAPSSIFRVYHSSVFFSYHIAFSLIANFKKGHYMGILI